MEGWISLDAAELRRALEVMSRVVPENQLLSHAGLWKVGHHAVLRIAGIEARIAAEGEWDDVVVTEARFFLSGHPLWPAAGNVCFLWDGAAIRASGIQDATRWRRRCPAWRRESADDWPRFVEQPAPFSDVDLLLLPLHYTQRDLEHSGLFEEWKEVAALAEDATCEGCGGSDWSDAEARDAIGVVESLVRLGLERLFDGLDGRLPRPAKPSWDQAPVGPAASRSAIASIPDLIATRSRQADGIPSAP